MTCVHEWGDTLGPGAQCLRGCGADYESWTHDEGADAYDPHGLILDRLAEMDGKLDRILAAPGNRSPIDPLCPNERCTRERGHEGFHHIGFEEPAA